MNRKQCTASIPGFLFPGRLLVGLVLVAALARPGQAQEAAQEPGPEPVTTPVPEAPSQNPGPEHQRAAEALFEQGAELYNELLYDDAAERFGRAAEYWLHPRIELHLALALSRAGRPVAAHDSLQKAVGLGLETLGLADRARAEKLRKALMVEQLAMMEVRCDEPGAQVSLDGRDLFVGPGTRTVMVRPASHVVTADKPGHFPARQSITLLPGHRGSIVIELVEDTIVETRRWQTWKPWAVVGAGTVLAVMGGGVLWRSQRNFDRADDVFGDDCAEAVACTPATPGIYSQAATESDIAVGMMATGAAVITAGLVLVVVNRTQRVRTEAPDAPVFDITPMLSPGGITGLGLSSRF